MERSSEQSRVLKLQVHDDVCVFCWVLRDGPVLVPVLSLDGTMHR